MDRSNLHIFPNKLTKIAVMHASYVEKSTSWALPSYVEKKKTFLEAIGI